MVRGDMHGFVTAARILRPLALGAGLLAIGGASVASAADPLERGSADYTLDPERGVVAVHVEISVPGNSTTLWIDDEASDVTFGVARGTLAPELITRANGERLYKLTLSPASGATRRVVADFDLPGGEPRSSAYTRAGAAYTTFCASIYGRDGGSTRVQVPVGYDVTSWGASMARSVSGGTITFTSVGADEATSWYACFGGGNPGGYARDELSSPSGREIVLESYPEDDAWRTAIGRSLGTELERVEALIGRGLPGDGALVVREVPSTEISGYAGLFEPYEQLIRIGEDHDQPGLVAHELAHAWFNGELFAPVWLVEGYAEWVGRRSSNEPCSAPSTTPDGGYADLDDWWFLSAATSEFEADMIDYQYEAACTIVSQAMERAGEDGTQAILGALLNRTNPYGSDLAGRPSWMPLSWTDWLDVVDEVGLLPNGHADLDFTQALMTEYGVADDIAAIIARSSARAQYHQLLRRTPDWTLPSFIRRDLAEWRFDVAIRAIGEANLARAALERLDRMQPELEALDGPVVELWERARSVDDAADVRALAEELAEVAERMLDGQSRFEAGGLVEAAGLVGADPRRAFAAAVDALQAGDAEIAREEVVRALDALDGAHGAGIVRLIAVGAGGFGLLLFVVLRGRRRRLAALAVVPVVVAPVPASAATAQVRTLEPGAGARVARSRSWRLGTRSAAMLGAAAGSVVTGALAIALAAVLHRRRNE